MWIKLRFLEKLVGAAYVQVRSIDRKLWYSMSHSAAALCHFTQTQRHTHTDTHLHRYTHRYTDTHTHTHRYTHTQIHTHTHRYTQTQTHTHTDTHTHTHTHAHRHSSDGPSKQDNKTHWLKHSAHRDSLRGLETDQQVVHKLLHVGLQVLLQQPRQSC